MTDQTERFHWGWVLSSATLGLAMLALAHLAALVWNWPEVSTGVISSIGAAFMLAFVLFLFERRFTRSVSRQVKDAAEAVVTARTRELGNRLDDLEERLNARRAKTRSAQDEAVAAIANDVSLETISAALAEAEGVGAIRGGTLTVPGSRQAPWLAVEFRFTTFVIARGDGLVTDDGTVPKLTIEIAFPKRGNEVWKPVILAEWTPDLTSDEIGTRLEVELRRRDRLAEAKVFDFPLALRNLQNGLKLALDNQRLPLGQEGLHGALYEVVDSEWVVTSAGVENVSSGLLVSREELDLGRWRDTPTEPQTVAPPAGVDAATWDYVVHRAGQQPEPNLFG